MLIGQGTGATLSAMPSRHQSVAAFTLAATVAIAPGCKRKPHPPAEQPLPTESMTVVIADPCPGLRKPRAHQHSDRTARKGEVLYFVKPSDTVEWSDKVEEERLSRAGPMLEVKRLPVDSSLFVWASDVSRDVPVVSASYLCSKIPGATWAGAPCEQSVLRRLMADGTTVGFVNCGEGPCPIVIAGPKGTATTRIEGLDDVRVARLGATDVLIASTHTSGNGRTGQELVVIAADSTLKRFGTIPFVEADPSKPEVLTWQVGWWKLQPEGIRVMGERAVVERATNKRLETRMIDDLWVLAPQGVLERRAAAPASSP